MTSQFASPANLFKSERFDLRKLHYFARIVELGSMSKASAALRIAQPALSKSIRCLEFDLRTPLLERSTKGVRPTRAGEKLYEHCKAVFRQLELARAEIQGPGDVPCGTVTIGIPYSVNLILAAAILRETLIRFPDVDLHIIEDHSTGIAAHLNSNRLDIGVMVSEGTMNAALHVEEVVQEELLLVRRCNGDGSEAGKVHLEEVVDRPLILAKGQLRAMVEERFARRALSLNAVREIETFNMIPRCVEAGIGDAILPAGWISALALTRTTCLSFEDKAMSRRLAICHFAARPLSYAAMCVKRLVQEVTAELIETHQWRSARLTNGSSAALARSAA